MGANKLYDCYLFNIDGPCQMNIVQADETASEAAWIDFAIAAINHPVVVDMDYAPSYYEFIKDFNRQLRVSVVDHFEVVLNNLTGLIDVPEFAGYDNGKFLGFFPGKPSKEDVLKVWNGNINMVQLESVDVSDSYGIVCCTISLYLDWSSHNGLIS